MKAWASIVTLTLVTMRSAGADPRNLAYEELPVLIRQSNQGLQAADSSTEAARLRTGSLERSFLPRFGFESGAQRQDEADGRSESAVYWKVDAASNIYRGGRDAMRDNLATAQVTIRSLDAQSFFRNELMKVRGDYIRLAAVQQLMQLGQDMSQIGRQKKRSFVQKIQAGLMAESFASDLLVFEHELERDRMFFEKEMHEIEDRLSLALGLALETTLLVKNLDSIDTGKQPVAEGLRHIPELKKLETEAQLTRDETMLRTEWWRPELDVFANYKGLNFEQQSLRGILPEREAAIGLRLTVNLQESAAIRKEVAARRNEAAALDLQRAYQTKAAELQFHEYRHDINALRPILETLSRHLVAAETLQKKIDAEFARGVRDSSDVLESLRRVYDIKKRRVETLLDYRLAQSGLQSLLDGS